MRAAEVQKGSMIGAATKKSADFVVIAEERNEPLGATVLKDKAKIAVAPAFEKLVPQLADAETAMHVRSAKSFDQVAEGQQALHLFVLREFSQAPDDGRIDGKEPIQAFP